MSSASDWIRFLRNYGPIPTNDNMYDESIQRALRRTKVKPLVLPAQFLDEVIKNFRSATPKSEVLTGTAGDGKTYHCREAWLALGGSESEWNTGRKVQRLSLGNREVVVVKDLSELRAEESAALLSTMATDVTQPMADRVYLIAANHGQLREKLKAARVFVLRTAAIWRSLGLDAGLAYDFLLHPAAGGEIGRGGRVESSFQRYCRAALTAFGDPTEISARQIANYKNMRRKKLVR